MGEKGHDLTLSHWFIFLSVLWRGWMTGRTSGIIKTCDACLQAFSSATSRARTHTHTTVLRLCGICPAQPGWAGTRRNIHPLTLIVVINHPNLLSPSTTNHSILHIQSTCSTVFFHNFSPSFLWSTSWPGTLHFILHTFLHPIIVFFSQHMPIPSQPVPL